MKSSARALLIVLATCLSSQTAQAAIVYTDQTAFEAAVGGGLVTEDFEGVPVQEIFNGPVSLGFFGAFGNGAAF